MIRRAAPPVKDFWLRGPCEPASRLMIAPDHQSIATNAGSPFPLPIAGEYSEQMQARPILIPLLIAIVASTFSALAQDKGTVNPQPLPPLEHPNDPKIGAKQLFARKYLPSAQPTKVIGEYTKGCLAGAAQMPMDG